MFTHKQVNLPELTTETIKRKRFYVTPEGNKYPSITTVLSTRKKEGLWEWRKRVGNDVANHIARTSAARGTKVHHMCEDFLNNNFDEEVHKKNFLPYVLFSQLKPTLMQKVNNIFAQECGLYSDKYKVAGRVDCIAEYNGIPSIVDFKTSTKERNDDWNESYYIQASAYAEMFEERTGVEINQICILVVTEDGAVQEFVKDKKEYVPLIEQTVLDWEMKNEKVQNVSSDFIGAPI